MSEAFIKLNIRESLAAALEKESISVPTEIQNRVIPKALENKDIIGQSQTGTGKTLAFLLPLFEKLDASKTEMQAIVLVPTHELAVQIQRQIERLVENSDVKLSSAVIIGNVNIQRQIDKLKERPNIIVGSPGRILELIKKRKITAHTVKTIVIDEADRLIDERNMEDVKAVIKSTQRDRQLMMFSATISEKTIAKAKELMKDPEIIKSELEVPVPQTIEHMCFFAEQRDKAEVLRKLIRILNPAKAIVFINKMEDVEVVAAKLQYHNLNAEAIHGANFKTDRKKTMEDFKAGKLKILLASDIAARGLHIEGITHIFNYDMPEDPGEYQHRVGRTGRSGNKGFAVSLASQRELQFVKACENKLKIEIPFKKMYEGKIFSI